MSIIYKITNELNGKFYVGSTTNPKVRFRQHRKLLRGNRHHCKPLQASWNKYGESRFVFSIVEHVDDSVPLAAVEDTYLTKHVGSPECFNTGRSSNAPWRNLPKGEHPSIGKTVSQEVKKKISDTLKAYYAEDYFNHPRVGKRHSDATRKLISDKKKGVHAGENHYRHNKTVSEEVRAKISAAQKGRQNKMKGKKMSEQGRANVAAAVKRGAESHFYGKPPTNVEDMKRAIVVVYPDGGERRFAGLSDLKREFGVSLMTIIRACKSGKPVAKGIMAGNLMKYAENS